MNSFDGKVAIVTGATTGIGRAIAAELYDRGATVVITGRKLQDTRNAATEIAAEMKASEDRIIPLQAEVKDHESVRRLIEQTLIECGRLDFLVNNAGITGPHGVSVCDYPVEDWNDVIATDLSGMFYGMKYGIPVIIESGGGAVVNLSSANGVVGIAGIAPYTAAKHGVIGLTRAAALEFADKGVRINAVGPGYVETERIRMLPESVREQFALAHPMKRMADGREVAKTVAFLLSGDSSFTTGAFYAIDGGYTAQ